MVKLLVALLLLMAPSFGGEVRFSLRGLKMVCLSLDHLPTDLEKRNSFRRAVFVTNIELQLRQAGLTVIDCAKPSSEEWRRVFPEVEAPQDIQSNAVPRLSLWMSTLGPEESSPYWTYDVSLSLIEYANVARDTAPIETATWRMAYFGPTSLSRLTELQNTAYQATREFVNQWLSDNPLERPVVVTRHRK